MTLHPRATVKTFRQSQEFRNRALKTLAWLERRGGASLVEAAAPKVAGEIGYLIVNGAAKLEADRVIVTGGKL